MIVQKREDWRGIPVDVGDHVVYAAGSGSSVGTVEGTVESFTDAGNARVRVIRRGIGGYGGKELVSVSPSSLTVVTALPRSPRETMREGSERRERERAERERVRDTHTFPELDLRDPQRFRSTCERCGDARYGSGLRECPNAVTPL